jgi:casein kinase 1 delta
MLDDRSKLYIVDYGIAKRIDSHSDPNKKNNFVGNSVIYSGTPRYASRNAHLGLKLGPLDDIESLLYILIFFIRRSLPWMHIAKEGNRKMDVIKKMKI